MGLAAAVHLAVAVLSSAVHLYQKSARSLLIDILDCTFALLYIDDSATF